MVSILAKLPSLIQLKCLHARLCLFTEEMQTKNCAVSVPIVMSILTSTLNTEIINTTHNSVRCKQHAYGYLLYVLAQVWLKSQVPSQVQRILALCHAYI